MAFPTKTNSSQSGSQKLAAFKARAAARASPGESPSQYRAKVTAPTPSPVTTQPSQKEVEAAVDRFKQKGLLESFIAAPGQVPTPGFSARFVSSFPTSFKQIQSKFEPQAVPTEATIEPQARLTSADITRRIQEATIEAQRAGFKATQDLELSPFSQRAFAQSQQIARTIREKTPDISTGGLVGTKEVGESLARFTEMGGMFVGGAETIVRRPEVVPSALTVAALETPRGFATQIREEPIQFLSDIGTGALIGLGIGKVVKPVTSKIPSVELKTTPQEPLVKIRVPKGEPIPEIKYPTVKQAEYRPTGLKISDVPLGEVIPQPKPAKTISAMIGETKGGFTDVYFRADKPTIRSLGDQFTGEVTQLKTAEGSFLAFEPTAPKPSTTITPKAEISKLPKQPEFKAIGELAEIKTGLNIESPFRVVKRTTLEPSAIELKPVSDVVKQPDFIEVTAKPIPGIKQLESGLIVKEIPRTRQFFKSTEATLAPKDKIYTTRKPTFVGEMEPFKQRVIFKEPQKAELASFLKSDLQAIMARKPPITDTFGTPKRVKIEVTKPRATRAKSPFASIFPVRAQVPSAKQQPAPSGITTTKPLVISSQAIKPITVPDTRVVTEPTTKVSFKPTTAFKSVFDTKPTATTAARLPQIKTFQLPKKKKKSKIQLKQSTSFKGYDWTIENPIASVGSLIK